MAAFRSWTKRDLLAGGFGAALGLLAVLANLASGPAGSRAFPPAGSAATGWVEIDWPLAVDPWWPSRAFTCNKAACGADMTLLVRAKLGFCNCATGVADDDELERIADFSVIGRRHAPTAAGRAVTVAGLKGRSRPYTVDSTTVAGGRALLIGVNDRCDAIVATAVLSAEPASGADRAVLAFLDSPRIKTWIEQVLGL